MVFQRLQDWQDLKGYTDVALAAKIGCGRTVLGRAKRGETQLKMKHQLALEELTGIKPSEWAEFYALVVKRGAGKATATEKKSLGRVVKEAA